MNSNGSIKFTVKSLFDESGVKHRFNDSLHRAQEKLDAQVLADSNYYVPLKTGTLQKSAIIATTIGSGVVRWVTPYAHSQYYGEHFDHSQQANPNACAKWFEAAKARRKDQWVRLVKDELEHS